MIEERHPPHIYAENAWYFITASTIRHRRLFDSDAKRALLRDHLQACTKSCGVSLFAWVILADHYHLLMRVGETALLYAFIRVLHSKSAQFLNKLDGTRGRNVWYQYWDRFARNGREFWSYFNYIHINPLKHGYVQIANGALPVEHGELKPEPERSLDLHECLASYPFSSYDYYLRKYGREFLTDVWLRYPLPDHIAGMET